MRISDILTLTLCLYSAQTFAQWSNTASGVGSTTDSGKYACALISNGSISTQIDNLGVQKQKKYVSFLPTVAWEGRRYGVPRDSLISHGYFDTSFEIDGKLQKEPIKWSQTLNNKEALNENVVEYPDATVKTIAFVPATREMIVVKKIITPKKAGIVKFDFKYKFAPSAPGKERERVQTTSTSLDVNCASFFYTAFGHKVYKGVISVMSDFPSAPSFADKDTAVLSSKAKASPENPIEISYFITFNDSFATSKYIDADLKSKELVSQMGFDKLLAEHKDEWEKYWQGSFIQIPDKEIEKTYYTGLYHQRCNSTKWSLPVGIFVNSHWNGRFFGWDEAFNAMSLATSGKFSDSRKPSEFRSKTLNVAINRATKRGKPRTGGARFLWESMEDGFEGSPFGFWIDHIFHMSNMVMETWGHYLYSNDKTFLKQNYELMVESALFYQKHFVYELDGRAVVGKCTDLERMGEAKFNPFMTSCGIIYTFEKTAAAADILGVDKDLAAQWRKLAEKLRKSLPNDGKKYVPYENSTDYSIGSVGGFYPYAVLDPNDKLAKAAVYDFYKNIYKGGNMYDTGKGINAWYAGWMSSALVNFNDKDNPALMLASAAKETGVFHDTYEINEPHNKVQYHPWFSTGSGNYIYALNQMLVRCTENGEIMICTSVPDSWNDIAFNLPCYGGLWLNVSIKNGKIESAELSAKGLGENGVKRVVVIPARFVDISKIVGEWVERDGFIRINAKAGEKFYK